MAAQKQRNCKIIFDSEVLLVFFKGWLVRLLRSENIRFSSLFAAGDVSRRTSPAAKSEDVFAGNMQLTGDFTVT